MLMVKWLLEGKSGDAFVLGVEAFAKASARTPALLDWRGLSRSSDTIDVNQGQRLCAKAPAAIINHWTASPGRLNCATSRRLQAAAIL